MAKLTQEQAAAMLGISARALGRNAAKYERDYGLKLEHEQGSARRAPVYDEQQIRELAERLKSPAPTEQAVPANLKTQSDESDEAASPVSAALTGQIDYGPLIAVLERLKVAPAETHPGLPTISDLAHKLTLSVAEASRLSGCSVKFLREAIGAGKLKAKMIRGRRGWIIKREDVEAFVRKL